MNVKTSKKEKEEAFLEMINFNTIQIDYTEKEEIGIKGITFTADLTRIDFFYWAPNKYINGGWASMEPSSFIRPVGSSVKMKMVGSFGIAIAPNKHYFKRCGEMLYYSLFFPALPKGTQAIDIIELEKPGNYFNFYDVSVLTKPINVDEELSAN